MQAVFYLFFIYLFIYLFFFWGGGGGGSRWWLVVSVHVTFPRHLGRAYTKNCPLSLPREQNVYSVCLHYLSGILFVTSNRSCRIQTYTPDAGDHGELSWSSFWLRWFSLLSTHWGPVYWHNASLVSFEICGSLLMVYSTKTKAKNAPLSTRSRWEGPKSPESRSQSLAGVDAAWARGLVKRCSQCAHFPAASFSFERWRPSWSVVSAEKALNFSRHRSSQWWNVTLKWIYRQMLPQAELGGG